jgi:hypothetical protein
MACENNCMDGFVLRMQVSTGRVTAYVCPCPEGDRHRAYFTKSNERLKYGKQMPKPLKPIQKVIDQKAKQYKDEDE